MESPANSVTKRRVVEVSNPPRTSFQKPSPTGADREAQQWTRQTSKGT